MGHKIKLKLNPEYDMESDLRRLMEISSWRNNDEVFSAFRRWRSKSQVIIAQDPTDPRDDKFYRLLLQVLNLACTESPNSMNLRRSQSMIKGLVEDYLRINNLSLD